MKAIILNGFVENTERLLGTTLFGTNLANVLVGVYASVLVARLFHNDNFALDFAVTIVASAFLLVFVTGVVADRFDRRRVAAATTLTREVARCSYERLPVQLRKREP